MIASDVASSSAGTGERPQHDAAALSLGDLLCDRYCLTRRVARGGCAVVYCALDELLGEERALKVMLPSERVELAALLREEALAAMRLSHPAIVRVFNHQQHAPWEFLVMEYVHGPSLCRHLRTLPKQRLRPEATVRVGIECLDALAYAHEAGVVHNDVKPSNILLTRAGSIKLCDFGLTPRIHALMRARGDVVGTPAYMSPERIRGGAGDARSDLYSLAATLYAVGNGQLAFCGQSAAQMQAHLRIPPPPSPHLPKRVHEVLRRAMAKRPDDRFQSAHDMQLALREAARDLQLTMTRVDDPEDGVPRAILAESSSARITARPAPPPPATTLALVEPELSSSLEIIIEGELPSQRELAVREPRVARGQMILMSGRELRSRWGERFEIAPVWIDHTPVTVEMYALFVRDTGHAPPADWLGQRPPLSRLDHPVTQVTLDDARAYARWRGCRLPTGLEWEAVARGPHGWRFPWGDEWDGTRCQGGERAATTAPVTAHPKGRSVEGCLDLVGNVWEWTERDPRCDEPRDEQVWVYGGSYCHACQQAGGLPRTRVVAAKSYAYLGFRCAATVEER